MIRRRRRGTWLTGSVVRWRNGSRRWKHCAFRPMEVCHHFRELFELFDAPTSGRPVAGKILPTWKRSTRNRVASRPRAITGGPRSPTSARLCGNDPLRALEKKIPGQSFLPLLVSQPLVRRQFAEELHTIEVVDYVLV